MVEVPVVPPWKFVKVEVPTERSFVFSVLVERSPVTVEEPAETNPVKAPAEFMEKTLVPAEFTNLRKSPVAF